MRTTVRRLRVRWIRTAGSTRRGWPWRGCWGRSRGRGVHRAVVRPDWTAAIRAERRRRSGLGRSGSGGGRYRRTVEGNLAFGEGPRPDQPTATRRQVARPAGSARPAWWSAWPANSGEMGSPPQPTPSLVGGVSAVRSSSPVPLGNGTPRSRRWMHGRHRLEPAAPRQRAAET